MHEFSGSLRDIEWHVAEAQPALGLPKPERGLLAQRHFVRPEV